MACDFVTMNRSFGATNPTPLAHCDLSPTLRAPAKARQFLANTLTSGGHHVPSDDLWAAQAIASELVTHAVLHARTNLHVGLALGGGTLLIAVADGHDATPRTATRLDFDEADHAESGRGMTLVAGLAYDFGWELRTQPAGKVMWATLKL